MRLLLRLVAGHLEAELHAAVGAADKHRVDADEFDAGRGDFAVQERRTRQRKLRARNAGDHVARRVQRFDVDEFEVGESFSFRPFDDAVAEADLDVGQAVVDHRLEAGGQQTTQRDRPVHRTPDKDAGRDHARDERDRGDPQSDLGRTADQTRTLSAPGGEEPSVPSRLPGTIT